MEDKFSVAIVRNFFKKERREQSPCSGDIINHCKESASTYTHLNP